jgi:dihydrolipoamide dehydrogenase
VTTHSTDLAVLGAGPGGYAAAFLAADLGMQVALIDTEPDPGGVCVYRGCIPSKALLHAAKVLDEAKHAASFGIDFGAPAIDVGKLRAWKDQVVHKLTSGTGQLGRLRKIKYVQGRAAIVDPTTFEVETSKGRDRVTFRHAILATGSRPATVPGLDLKSPRLMDSTSALDLPDVPGTLLVVGGGYIGLELGTVYAALGTKVTVVEMTPGLLPGADRDLVAVLQKRIEATFESVLLETKVVGLKEEAEGLRVTFEDTDLQRRDQVFDKVLVAVGRKPNSTIPGLQNTRVQLDARGFIKVDASRRTAEPTLYAIGDVAGEPMLAHKASHEGRAAVEAIHGEDVVFAPNAIPAVVFTDPEIAWCGLTEEQARREGRRFEIAKFAWGASGRATTLGRNDGLTKLIVEPGSERILGVGIVGSGAGELIAEGVLAIEMGAVASDLKLTIHPHPTLSETVMESAEMFFGQSTHAYRPKRKAGS